MINTDDSCEIKKTRITELIGRVTDAIISGKVPTTMQMLETKVNCQPHYKYKSIRDGYVNALLIELLP